LCRWEKFLGEREAVRPIEINVYKIFTGGNFCSCKDTYVLAGTILLEFGSPLLPADSRWSARPFLFGVVEYELEISLKISLEPSIVGEFYDTHA
jgi:hypothetical protein